ncbi:MAG: hypothetical protein AB7K09_10215 [Planctomycetota bacterium]
MRDSSLSLAGGAAEMWVDWLAPPWLWVGGAFVAIVFAVPLLVLAGVVWLVSMLGRLASGHAAA